MFPFGSSIKKFKVPLFLMLAAILMSFVVPTVLAQPDNSQKRLDAPVSSDLAYNLDAYFTMINYNEPANPYVLINYYYENGSHIRMIFGMERIVFPSINMNLQYDFVQVFDAKGKLSGLGVRTRSKSNLYIFVPV